MAEIKKISTELQLLNKFLDTSGSAGSSGSVLTSTATGTSWVSAGTPGSGVYLPLAGGTMTGVTQFNDHTQHGDQVKAKWGTGNDLEISHNGSHSFVTNNTGDLNLSAATGKIYFSQNQDNGEIVFENDNGSGGVTTYLTIDGLSENTKFSKPAFFGDGVKALFGNGNDLQIYHDGSNSFIQDTGAGDLYIDAAANFFVRNQANGEVWIKGTDSGVSLRFQDSQKLITTNTGITVTGKISGLTAGTANTDAVNLQQLNDATTGALIFVGTWSAAPTTTSVLNGAINNDGTIVITTANPGISVGATITGTGISGTVTVSNVAADGITIAISSGQTIADGVTLTFTTVGGTPDLSQTSRKVTGHYYICETAGVATPNGASTTPNEWAVGDWVAFSDLTTDAWQKIDNSSVLSGAGTGGSLAAWSGSGTSVTLQNAPATFSGNDTTFAGAGTFAGNLSAASGIFNSGTTNVVASFTSTDGIAGIALIDNAGSVELSGTGNTFKVQPAGGAAALTVSSTTATFAGNVGIGGSPSHTLDVKGADTNNATIARFYSNTATRGSFIIKNGFNVSPTTFIGTAGGSEQLSIGTNSTEAIRIDGSQNAIFTGKVGIGASTAPTVPLDVSGGVGGVSIRVKGDMSVGAYYYGFMFDGTNLKGTTETNIFYSGSTIAAETTIASYAGIKIDTPNVSATNAVVTNNYGIYQSSTLQKNFFNGKVGIGTTVPTGNLNVESSGNQFHLRASTATAGKFWNFDVTSNNQLFIINNGNLGMNILDNGNVGIGDTSPTSISANTFSLSVNSSRTDLSGGLISKANGTVKHQQYWDTGGYNFSLAASSGNFKFTGGNVGIGTTNPTEPLEVVGFSKFQAAGGGVIFLHREDNTVANGNQLGSVRFGGGIEGVNDYNPSAARIIGLASTHSGSYQWSNTDTASELQFGTTEAGGTTLATKMTIKHDGKVGIGTTNPQNTLHLGDNTASSAGTLRIDSFVANQFWKFEPGTNTLNIKDYDGTSLVSLEGASNYVLFNAGNVGIGISSPTQKLHVAGNARVTGKFFDSSNSAGAPVNNYSKALTATSSGTAWKEIVFTPDIWEVNNGIFTSATTLVCDTVRAYNGNTNTTAAGAGAGEIRIVDAGVYEIIYSVAIQVGSTSITVRQNPALYLTAHPVDGSEVGIPGSVNSVYLRLPNNNQGGRTSFANTCYYEVPANTDISLNLDWLNGAQSVEIYRAFGIENTISIRKISDFQDS